MILTPKSHYSQITMDASYFLGAAAASSEPSPADADKTAAAASEPSPSVSKSNGSLVFTLKCLIVIFLIVFVVLLCIGGHSTEAWVVCGLEVFCMVLLMLELDYNGVVSRLIFCGCK